MNEQLKKPKLSGNTFEDPDIPQPKFQCVACFVLELVRPLHKPKKLWRCPFIKHERTIGKAPNFQEILWLAYGNIFLKSGVSTRHALEMLKVRTIAKSIPNL